MMSKNSDESIKLWNTQIPLPDANAGEKAQLRWDGIAKPLDGLGRFEKMIVKIAAMQGTEEVNVSPAALVIMCADNGIVEEGVSQSGQEVTAAVLRSMARRESGACRMAKAAGVDIFPIDIGVAEDVDDLPELTDLEAEPKDLSEPVGAAVKTGYCQEPAGAAVKTRGAMGQPGALNGGILKRKIRKGTRNFLKESALTEEETVSAIETGIEVAKQCHEKGYRLLLTGEMGIGNTTTSAALTAALLNRAAEDVCGRGAGLDDAGLARKREVVAEGLARYGYVIREKDGKIAGGEPDIAVLSKTTAALNPDPAGLSGPGADSEQEAGFRALANFGGLDIAGLVGVFIGGAMCRMPVVIDGVISAVAALVARRIVPGCGAYQLASHIGRERSCELLMKALELEPVICGDLAFGEGTGALMLTPLLEMALAVYRGRTSFEDLSMQPYGRYV